MGIIKTCIGLMILFLVATGCGAATAWDRTGWEAQVVFVGAMTAVYGVELIAVWLIVDGTRK